MEKESAITRPIPAYFKVRAACSLADPQPKFFPATRISPFFTLEAKLLSRPSKACFATSSGSKYTKYWPGYKTSVSILSPYFHTGPIKCILIPPPVSHGDLLSSLSRQQQQRWQEMPGRYLLQDCPFSP